MRRKLPEKKSSKQLTKKQQSFHKEILEFIRRRFSIDSKWTEGNCYYFAIILRERFGGEIYYDSAMGHFYIKIGILNYDYEGLYEPITEHKLEMIKTSDPIWYDRLYRDCVS